jgi:7-cyano-7-deazaguanine reductase
MSDQPEYTEDHARSGVEAPLPEIETWPNQYPGYQIEISMPEFTSGCPITEFYASFTPLTNSAWN